MAQVKNTATGEGFLAEEEAASAPSAEADNPRDVVCVSDMDGERFFSALGRQHLAACIPFRGVCLLGELCQKIRGVAAESTNFRDQK
jgi:hypothetical protein